MGSGLSPWRGRKQREGVLGSSERELGEDGDVPDCLIHFGRQGNKVRYLYENEEVIVLAVRHMRESGFYLGDIPDA